MADLRNTFSIVFMCLMTSVFGDSPDFPTRNIDTRTIKKINGKFQTPTPHLPIMKMSLDGRIGLALHRRNSYRFNIIKPESVNGHFKNQSNNKVGGNMIGKAFYYNNFYQKIAAKFKNKVSDFGDYEPGFESFLCEKNDISDFPYVCNTKEHDCYRLTLISPMTSKTTQNMKAKTRFASIDLMVMVKNPKTTSAYIEHLFPISNSEQVGKSFPFRFSAEHNVVGDQRFMIYRVGGRTTRDLNSGRIGADRNNIVYMNYPEWSNGKRTPQCDVTKWNSVYPITHAHYDKANNMKGRYKFARYPIRDGIGNLLDGSKDLGGSYPWMDEDAANLFFTATGPDRFYNWLDGSIKGIYEEPKSNYVTPLNISSSVLSKVGLDRIDAFEKRDRTVGVAFAGFWSHGKTIVVDGLLNNTDYNFEISTPGISDLTRKLKLYKGTPGNQSFESTGITRDQGAKAVYGDYASNMVHNANYMNSITNRFNYLKKMKPGVPKDITWHFSSTRHGEELAFDEYISPFVVINADMTAAVGRDYNNKNFSMVNFDGFQNGKPVNSPYAHNFYTNPKLHSLLFQNGASAPKSFMTVPAYGRPIGDMRVEPIAKGGIYGKGAWLSGRSGIQFKVPEQSWSSKNRFKLENQKDMYVGLFIDSRWNGNVNTYTSRSLIQLGNKKIRLVKSNSKHSDSHVRFDKLLLTEGSTVIAESNLPGPSKIYNEKSVHDGWRHLGIQFRNNASPILYVDGMAVGVFSVRKGVSSSRMNNFFNLDSGDYITLGTTGSDGFRGWADEFKVIARLITRSEERCNLARGTLVKLNSSASGYLKWRSSQYPAWEHRTIAGQSRMPSNSKFVCYTNYGNYDMKTFTDKESYASLHTIPKNTVSVRSIIITDNRQLKYGSPRPDQTTNNFCLSCHVPSNQNPNRELNRNALIQNSNLRMEHDRRRQPDQPPAKILGIIPANYFGSGKPKYRLNNNHHYNVDQWILP